MDIGHDGSQVLGARLQRARVAAGVSQEELAERAGLSVRTVRDLERGRTRRPYPRTMRLLVAALGLSEAAAAQLMNLSAASQTDLTKRPSEPVVPRQLPATIGHFVGRVPEQHALGQLEGQCGTPTGAVPICVLSGTAGIGKTALALHWAHQVADRFPDGQLYVNLRGFGPRGAAVDVATAVRGFLNAFGIPAAAVPTDPDEQLSLYRSRLATKRLLILLDNARTADQVRPLLPGSAGCLVLVTSRDHLSGLVALDGAVSLVLRPVSSAEAWELLTRRLGAERTGSDRHVTTALAGLCAHLPLALNIAAARAATRPEVPLPALVEELRQIDQRLDLLSVGAGAADLRTVLSWSYQTLSPAAARMFRLLGIHEGPDISVPAAANLAGLTGRPAARRALDELVAGHLLTEDAPGRYAFHDLLRAYAAEMGAQQDSRGERRAAIERVLDHYLYTGRAAAVQLHRHGRPLMLPQERPAAVAEPVLDPQHANAWFAAEYPVLHSAVIQAAETGFDRHAWQIAWTLFNYSNRQGYWRDLVTCQRIALAAATRLGDLAGQGNANRFLGLAHYSLQHRDEAARHVEQALAWYRRAGDRAGQARVHIDLGVMLDAGRRHLDAIDHAKQALVLYADAGDKLGQALAGNALGWFHTALGNYHDALAHCEHALAIYQEAGDRHSEADVLDSLGFINHQMDQHDGAVEYYERAIDIYRQIGDHNYQCKTLVRLGDTHRAAGRPAAARGTWQQALDMLDGRQQPGAEALLQRIHDLRTAST
ncbi:MAG TPA: tetratricopeptide repeat protein [Actinoplanes sp.]|jgi:tetratricopeptide (TPR) repeat protein/transcriptional regulator with XRE-family HTH domain